MATEVKLPELGDGIESGDVLEVFVSVGDVISEGQDIVEMETDKATVPVPTTVGGKVTKILVKEGESVPIGGALIEVEAAAGSPAPAAPAAKPAPAKEETAKPAPAAAEAKPAPPAPVAAKPAPTPPSAPPTAPAAAEPAAPAAPVVSNSGAIPAGPAVRRFAREVGVDLSNVTGSGEHGRINRDDILAVVRSASQSAKAGSAPATAAAPNKGNAAASAGLPGTADQDDFGPIRVERMSKIRKTISRQMHASWSTVPRVTNFDDADITDLERLRQSSKEDYAAQGLKLTTMPFLIKAVATALKHHPSMNATIDEANEQIIYKDYVNVGIAVDTDRGLVVPVMPATDQQGVPAITRSLAEMAGKVRGGNFGMNDLRGGSFTISNLGAIGGQYSTPIVNVPEVAILLVGRSRKLPVVMPDDSIQPRLMMPLSLSYDHRLVDGGTAARFLNDVIGFLEAPSRLLLAL
ncbi:Dihydrolipoyllysine-residue acetyltransferase component of pyruvate dehydrogenase complex [Rubripirellula lacrimiformis]|uniref:Dihydrolipoamide acetyltransferase component of pyruvate dehydrogenase complex n=1 Tax=Rubripirellula lacrimiformis TaxID=1930273 RepID=A0A517N891_9BACT|nr:2-oxo acid dehydrogenase subunit E2 [Rubripirellula lacrimiformis]QDT03342.1 Dihydrolipoyllysine-residue acetyltransferase component of pyruvate dehydrogenase complex [Rubripirellula lacrimiformis]